ncbi:MAG: hypothetical protein ABR612_10170 [Chromatocurvus sp.]
MTSNIIGAFSAAGHGSVVAMLPHFWGDFRAFLAGRRKRNDMDADA